MGDTWMLWSLSFVAGMLLGAVLIVLFLAGRFVYLKHLLNRRRRSVAASAVLRSARTAKRW